MKHIPTEIEEDQNESPPQNMCHFGMQIVLR